MSRDGGAIRTPPSRFVVFLRLAPVAVVFLAGCRSVGKPDKKYDLITAELRTRDRELMEARAELYQLRLMTQTYQRQGAPGCLPGGSPEGTFTPTSSASTPALPLKEIVLANGTGGMDNDQTAGDEALQVVVVPKDEDGSPVKAPGTLRVSAYDITSEGLKIPIGRWEVTPEQLRRAWRSGVFSTGYFVPFQWDQLPSNGKVRLVARFTTLDGRDYETDKDVNVRPMPNAGPRGPVVPSTPGAEPKIPPPEVPELPPPAGLKVNPTSQSGPGVEELPPPAATLGKIKALP